MPLSSFVNSYPEKRISKTRNPQRLSKEYVWETLVGGQPGLFGMPSLS